MQRRRQERRANPAGSSAWLQEYELAEPADFAGDAKLFIKADQVGAAAEKHMLTVVDDLAGSGMLVGRCASAHVGPALEESDAHSGISQRAAGRESGESAADDRYGFTIGRRCHVRRRRNPRESTVSFSQVVSRTRSVRTS